MTFYKKIKKFFSMVQGAQALQRMQSSNSSSSNLRNPISNSILNSRNSKNLISMIKKILILSFSLQFLLLSNCTYDFSSQRVGQLLLPSIDQGSSPYEENVFYLDLDQSYYNGDSVEPFYDLNTTEEIGDSEFRDSVSNCEIGYDEDSDLADSASKTKICVLDIMEYDLLINELHITYNVPEGMCDYVSTIMPWHYNRKVGKGPETIFTCNPPAAVGDAPAAEGETYFCASQADAIAGRVPDGTSKPGYKCEGPGTSAYQTNCFTEIEDLCKYKPTADGEEIFCCKGEYTDSEGVHEWEMNSACLGGPGATDRWEAKKNNFPIPLLAATKETGLREVFAVDNALDVGKGNSGSSAYIANYLKFLDKPAEDLAKISRTDTQIPDFLKAPTEQGNPIFRRQTDPRELLFKAPQLFFQVECLDSAGEVLHKLQLMVREWNTYEEFISYLDGDDKADPDVDGTEGQDCDYEDRKTFQDSKEGKCNDLIDFDDLKKIGKKYPKLLYGGGGSSESSGDDSGDE